MLKSSAILYAVKISGAFLGFLLYVSIAKGLDKEAFAEFAQITAFSMMLSMLFSLNIEAGAFRFLNKYIAFERIKSAQQFIASILRPLISLAILLVLGGFLAQIFGWFDQYPDALNWWLGALASPLIAFARVNEVFGNAAGEVRKASLSLGLLRPLVFFTLIYLLFDGLDLTTVLILFLLANAASATLSLVLVWSEVKPYYSLATPRRRYVRCWLRYGGVMVVPLIFIQYLVEFSTLLFSIFGDLSEIAEYAVAAKIVQAINFANMAVTQSIRPSVAFALNRNQIGEAENQLRRSGRLKLFLTLMAFPVVWLVGDYILSFFGEEYIGAFSLLLLLLVFETLLSVLLGPTIFVASASGMNKEYLRLFLTILMAMILIVPMTVKLFGIYGGVVAAYGSYQLLQLGLRVKIQQRLSLSTFKIF